MDTLNKITVGIRAYNVQHYIEECLDSVYNQTIKDYINVVIIEDCSTDNTINIIENWIGEHKDFSIQLYKNQINKGAGVGLMLLQEYIQNTEYVIILDGDDFYLKTDCLEYMYNFIKKHDFDFVDFFGDIQLIHTGYLMKYNLYKQIKFNPFRFGEDGYGIFLKRITDNWVSHKYLFYYYRNNGISLCYNNKHKNPLLDIFYDVYYKGIPEAIVRLTKIQPEPEYQDIYNEMLNVKYDIHPAVLVLTKGSDLKEWIKHYISLGFEHIFILDNNEHPIKLESPNITILPYNEVPFVTWLEFQSTAYDYALSFIKNTIYNYLLVVDDDEYLNLKKHSNIIDHIEKELLVNGFYNCSFQWETYDDNNIIYEKDCKESIQDTYTRKLMAHKQSDVVGTIWCKVLFRVLPEVYYNKACNPGHFPNTSLYSSYFQANAAHIDVASIKHYRTQCLETFLKNKVLQKNFAKGNFGNNGLLTSYFTINEITLEKLEAYKELCNKYGIEYDQEEYNKFLNLLPRKNNKN